MTVGEIRFGLQVSLGGAVVSSMSSNSVSCWYRRVKQERIKISQLFHLYRRLSNMYRRVGPNMNRDSASWGAARTPPGCNRSPETSLIVCRTASDTVGMSTRNVAVLDVPYLYQSLGHRSLSHSRSIRLHDGVWVTLTAQR